MLVFQTNGKQPYSFPVLPRFCNCLFCVTKLLIWRQNMGRRVRHGKVARSSSSVAVPLQIKPGILKLTIR